MIDDFFKDMNVAVTVCDHAGIVLYMNDKAAKTFDKWGGRDLMGKSLMDCHNPTSQAKIKELIAENKSNTYTIEKNGIKKLIHQAPWYDQVSGKLAGLVEYSIELPSEMPHFIR